MKLVLHNRNGKYHAIRRACIASVMKWPLILKIVLAREIQYDGRE
jgi:hypothetical protein